MIKKVKCAEIWVNGIKAIIYGMLVFIIVVYCKSNENAPQSINLFTGFTFLFSVVECVDNICIFFLSIIDNLHNNEEINEELFYKEEQRFREEIMQLKRLGDEINNGNSLKDIIEKARKIIALVWGFNLPHVKAVLEQGCEECIFQKRIDTFLACSLNQKLLHLDTEKIEFSNNEYEEYRSGILSIIELEKEYDRKKERIAKQYCLMKVVGKGDRVF